MSFDLTELNGRKIYEREAGILMPIFSLPNRYGIGDIGKSAENFVDCLSNGNQQLWAMLPNNPTGYGNSPYQATSAFAGNHYFISPDGLIAEGLLKPEEVARLDFGSNPQDIDYGKIFVKRQQMLNMAYQRWLAQGGRQSQEFLAFRFKSHTWLDDYALFMAIKETRKYEPWYQWPDDLKFRNPEALQRERTQNADKICFWQFTQYQFFKQWDRLKDYAHQKGIKLIGDVPFYMNYDSADVWGKRELFDLNPDGSLRLVAGIPNGQNSGIRWGNPCYNWQKMQENNYAWFAEKMHQNGNMYDMVRLDHAVAFVHFFGISDYDSRGQWYEGPDMHKRSVTDIIDAVAKQHKMDIIVENLGNNNQRTHDLYDQLNWLGMRIFDFTVGDMHYGTRNIHHPYLYPQNVAAYTGTHDNESLAGIIASKSDADLEYLKAYLRVEKREDIVWGAIDTLYKSSAAKVIIPMQDVLSLGNESRICYADNFEKSWRWRMENADMFSETLQKRLQGLSVLSARGWVQEHEIQSKGWREIYRQAIKNRYSR